MSKIKNLTQEAFDLLPVGQLFVEASGSGHMFVKARKTTTSHVEMICVDSFDFCANYKEVRFSPECNLEPVSAFVDARGKINTFEELKEIFEC